MYIVKDSYGVPIGKVFNSYKAAETFKIMSNRYDWTITKTSIHGRKSFYSK